MFCVTHCISSRPGKVAVLSGCRGRRHEALIRALAEGNRESSPPSVQGMVFAFCFSLATLSFQVVIERRIWLQKLWMLQCVPTWLGFLGFRDS